MLPLITLEEHYVSPYVRAAQEHDEFAFFPPALVKKLNTLGEERLQDMDAGKVALQIISHGPGDMPASVCSAANDDLASAIFNNPTRLAGFALLPVSNPTAAASELERSVKDLGFVGALIDTHINGEFYDDEKFWNMFEKAQELDVPIYIHPSWAAESTMDHYRGNYDESVAVALSAYGWGWHSDTALHILKLYASGLFDRFPKLKIIIGHMGELQMIGIGYIVSTWIGYGSLHAPDTSEFQWRFPLAFQVVPAIILGIGMIFVPESPRYLIEKNQYAEARRVLRKLHYDGSNGGWIELEYNNICQTMESEKSVAAPGWLPMFTVPKWRTRMLHGLAVQVFTQMTGINVITYYQTIMYKALGITGSRNTLVIGIYNCVGPLTNLIFVVFILDRIGRRKPLLFGTVGISIALICEAVLNSQNPDGQQTGYSIGGVFFLFAVSIIFSLSFGPCSWVYMAEVMPMQIRGKGNAFAVGIGNWAVGTLWNQVSPIALGKLRWQYYFVFVAWNLCVSLPVIYLLFQETQQKSLEDIDLLFERRSRDGVPDMTDEAVEQIESGKIGVTSMTVEHVGVGSRQ